MIFNNLFVFMWKLCLESEFHELTFLEAQVSMELLLTNIWEFEYQNHLNPSQWKLIHLMN